ncbi:toxin-antitoxin system HicB family antitoxin [Candidatus Gottesmanbacteria bacterium]|nr:toxin-antitoxin system HicB family antitoxin [Candidatus Gottesmanbacteria bacterium]
MNTSMIVTNIRMPKQIYTKVKTLAAEKGISFNQYINQLVAEKTRLKQLGLDKKPLKRNQYPSLWDLAKLAKLPSKPMGASKDDKIIYGIDDR